MKHKNDTVIRAWLDGKTVQYQQSPGHVWVDHTMTVYACPNFVYQADGGAWRIKPEPRVLWAVFKDILLHGAYSTEYSANATVDGRDGYTVVKMQEISDAHE